MPPCPLLAGLVQYLVQFELVHSWSQRWSLLRIWWIVCGVAADVAVADVALAVDVVVVGIVAVGNVIAEVVTAEVVVMYGGGGGFVDLRGPRPLARCARRDSTRAFLTCSRRTTKRTAWARLRCAETRAQVSVLISVNFRLWPRHRGHTTRICVDPVLSLGHKIQDGWMDAIRDPAEGLRAAGPSYRRGLTWKPASHDHRRGVPDARSWVVKGKGTKGAQQRGRQNGRVRGSMSNKTCCLEPRGVPSRRNVAQVGVTAWITR